MAAKGLVPQSTPGEVTRPGHNGERPSVLDLTWLSGAALLFHQFLPPVVDWAGSLGSNHALIRVEWVLLAPLPRIDRVPSGRFSLNVTPSQYRRWVCMLQDDLPPLRLLQSPSDIDAFV